MSQQPPATRPHHHDTAQNGAGAEERGNRRKAAPVVPRPVLGIVRPTAVGGIKSPTPGRRPAIGLHATLQRLPSVRGERAVTPAERLAIAIGCGLAGVGLVSLVLMIAGAL